QANRIASLLHWEELLVLNNRTDRFHRSAEACKLTAQEQLFPMMRLVRSIQCIERKTGKDLAGDDTGQRIGTGNSAECKIRKQGLRSVAQSNQRRIVKRIRDAHTLQRPVEGIAQRSREARTRLRVVLQVLQVILGQI